MFKYLKFPKDFPPNLAVKIVQKKNFKHLKIRFDYDSSLIVNLPKYITKRECEQFIDTNLQWILTHFKKGLEENTKLDWNQFYLFGQWVGFDAPLSYLDHSLKITLEKTLQNQENNPKTLWNHSQIGMQNPAKDFENLIRKLWQIVMQRDEEKSSLDTHKEKSKVKFRFLLTCIYQRALESYINLRVKEISQAMQLFPSRIDYGKSYRQLGCCKVRDQSIRFSLRLALMPHFCIDSVIIHELAHLCYSHHKQDFWNLVHRFDTNPKRINAWLRTNFYSQAQLYQRIFK